LRATCWGSAAITKGSQLMREAIYELSLDKQFVFHVTGGGSSDETPVAE